MFNLCFVELTMGNYLLVDIPPLVYPIMFGCTDNDPYIHYFSMTLMLALRVSGRFLVLLIYLIIWTNLAQLELSGSLILMVRN